MSRIFWSLFPSHIAAVSTATFGSRCIAANRAALTASVYALLDEVLSGMIPSSACLERRRGVELDRVLHGRLEPVPLVGQDVEQDRAFHRLDLLEVDCATSCRSWPSIGPM